MGQPGLRPGQFTGGGRSGRGGVAAQPEADQGGRRRRHRTPCSSAARPTRWPRAKAFLAKFDVPRTGAEKVSRRQTGASRRTRSRRERRRVRPGPHGTVPRDDRPDPGLVGQPDHRLGHRRPTTSTSSRRSTTGQDRQGGRPRTWTSAAWTSNDAVTHARQDVPGPDHGGPYIGVAPNGTHDHGPRQAGAGGRRRGGHQGRQRRFERARRPGLRTTSASSPCRRTRSAADLAEAVRQLMQSMGGPAPKVIRPDGSAVPPKPMTPIPPGAPPREDPNRTCPTCPTSTCPGTPKKGAASPAEQGLQRRRPRPGHVAHARHGRRAARRPGQGAAGQGEGGRKPADDHGRRRPAHHHRRRPEAGGPGLRVGPADRQRQGGVVQGLPAEQLERHRGGPGPQRVVQRDATAGPAADPQNPFAGVRARRRAAAARSAPPPPAERSRASGSWPSRRAIRCSSGPTRWT